MPEQKEGRHSVHGLSAAHSLVYICADSPIPIKGRNLLQFQFQTYFPLGCHRGLNVCLTTFKAMKLDILKHKKSS